MSDPSTYWLTMTNVVLGSRCQTHAQCIAWHPARAVEEPEEEVLGMSFPRNRFYHRGHTWARPEAEQPETALGPRQLRQVAESDRLGGAGFGAGGPETAATMITMTVIERISFRARRRGIEIQT